MDPSRPACQFDPGCYRLNEHHLGAWRHPHIEAKLDLFLLDPDLAVNDYADDDERRQKVLAQLQVLKKLSNADPVAPAMDPTIPLEPRRSQRVIQKSGAPAVAAAAAPAGVTGSLGRRLLSSVFGRSQPPAVQQADNGQEGSSSSSFTKLTLRDSLIKRAAAEVNGDASQGSTVVKTVRSPPPAPAATLKSVTGGGDNIPAPEKQESLGAKPKQVTRKMCKGVAEDEANQKSTMPQDVPDEVEIGVQAMDLEVPAREGAAAVTPSAHCRVGVVTEMADGECTIMPANGESPVFFEEDDVKNVGKVDVAINVGSRVRYEVTKRDASVAEVVYVDEQSKSEPSKPTWKSKTKEAAKKKEAAEERSTVEEGGEERVFPPGKLNKIESRMRPDLQGTIARVPKGKDFGFITVDNGLPAKYGKKDVFFHFNTVRNVGSKDVVLGQGNRVNFLMNKKDEFIENPRAFLVFVDDQSHCATATSSGRQRVAAAAQNGLNVGSVVRLDKDKVFLTDSKVRREVFMHADKISLFALPLKVGDQVAYILGDKSKNFVLKAKVHTYCARSLKEYTNYFATLKNALSSAEANRAMLETYSLAWLWEHLGGVTFPDVLDLAEYVFALLKMLAEVFRRNRRENIFQEVMKSLFQTDLVENVRAAAAGAVDAQELVDSTDTSRLSLLADFCRCCIVTTPQFAKRLSPLLLILAKEASLPVVMSVFDECLNKLSLQSGETDATNWKTLPQIPSEEELAGDLLSEDKHLSKVRVTQPYSSAEEYMDTYFRLLRAESFHAIQKGIKDLVAGKLDHRDMHCYNRVFFAGMEVGFNGISLAVQFNPSRKVPDWEKSNQLMFGNLLCLSANAKFDQVIWATVANRDPVLLNKSCIIFVDVCDFNPVNNGEVISRLQTLGGQILMVESPTYFHSVRPILDALQGVEMTEFGLQEQIVKAKPSLELPQYRNFDFEAETCEVSDDDEEATEEDMSRTREEAQGQFDLRAAAVAAKTVKASKGLDEAQLSAFNYALDNRLAIIQGPPGCGKTFLGVRLLEVLLEWKLDRPILLMTYKNHALDEFLKHASELPNCSLDEIVRIGGRSKEPALEKCNLSSLKKLESSSNAIRGKIKEMYDIIDALREDIYKTLEQVHHRSSLEEMDVLCLLSDVQLQLLAQNCAWATAKAGGPLYYRVNSQTVATRQWVQNELLPKITAEFISLSNFVDCWVGKRLPKQHYLAQHFQKLILVALQNWLPDKSEMNKLLQLQERCVWEMFKDAAEPEEDKEEDKEEMDDFDADYIRELQEARQSASGKIQQGEKIAKKALLLKPNTLSGMPNHYKLTDFPPDVMKESSSILGVDDLWSLSNIQRCQFIYSLLLSSRASLVSELNGQMEKLEEAFKQKKALESSRAVQAVNRMKVIGVTITGASINHELIQKVSPSIVIVEEAAEILEPSLLAALNPSVQHLILIGDHKQLPPQVDTYSLVRNYNFDTSMMERLIMTGYPFKALRKQSRMRVEFSRMLKDIYPDLEDNMTIVAKNKSPNCMANSMFFWAHDHMEDSAKKGAGSQEVGRSKQNVKEADMVIALVLFLVQNGYDPKQITLLSGYLGQQKILRFKLRQAQIKFPHLFPAEKSDNFVQIQTIDNYQGDENDIIILSLVRANPEGKLGFLNTQNRRCVAQSRAKCGMYFVGHMQTFDMETTGKGKVFKSVWSHVIQEMSAQGCVGSKIKLQCWKHKELSQTEVDTSDEIMDLVEDHKKLCSMQCGDLFPCLIKEHACAQSCSPKHTHYKCSFLVTEKYPTCGHPLKRRCWEDANNIPCPAKVDFTHQKCGHPGQKKCHVQASTLTCHHPCKSQMICALHDCPAKCGDPHTHVTCKAVVKFTFSKCGHEEEKLCHQSESELRCKEPVDRTLPDCKHVVQAMCSLLLTEIECHHPCQKKMSCGIHACPAHCGKAHNHDNCQAKVDYSFPGCHHPSSRKKLCSEKITWKCKYLVEGTSPSCGHPNRKECHEPWTAVSCPFRPCTRQRKCGHVCTNKCGEDCDKGNCDGCEEEFEVRMRKVRFQAKRKADEMKRSNGNVPDFTRCELKKEGDTMAEYMQVVDKVVKYCQPMHNFNPDVTKIEKVTNNTLELRFQLALSNAFGYNCDEKFHGTSNEGVDGIVKDGFRVPGPPKFGQKPGMYGQGIYFATDSSKSAQVIYTKGSNKLLLCKVLLGRSKNVTRADNQLSRKILRHERFDSVFAVRGSDVLNDEFVVFDSAQAVPLYVIHYRTSGQMPDPRTLQLTSNQVFEKIRLDFSRSFQANDPKEFYYRTAESHFLRMMGMGSTTGIAYNCKISYVEYIVNKDLERTFERKKAEFKRKSVPDHEVLAFHGTSPTNIDSILKSNLDPKRTPTNGRVHGHGCYFSEFPNVSLGYGQGKGLILFRTLPGREYNGPTPGVPSGHNSKIVKSSNNAAAQSYGDMLIIQDAAQFVPYFVYHFQ